EAIIYADGNDASGLPDDNYNPYSYTITKEKVTSKTVLKLRMAPCGGFAISLRECE
ncbi:MAG: glycoside hydrolase family 97 C-terminal domain-containing protein, partial [Bacteroidales bacterium]|nr:glycoside hydrolase family 97 C-terminal domain-containing protein [Bacteroidales bacterium]